jgi:DNA adenine methylase
MVNNELSKFKPAKPFLKWAGGKTQLIFQLESRLPDYVLDSKVIERYVEPFVGGGAFFFFLKSNYLVKNSFLLDVNPELIMAYKVIQNDHLKISSLLNEMEYEHLQKSEDSRKRNYYFIRDAYNEQLAQIDYDVYNEQWIQRAAYLIFLNKTCYNGLFRLNRNGKFNVPFGRYRNPSIYDEVNIKLVHQALKNTKLLCADFSRAGEFIEKDSLVYLDPPYRPLSSTSYFTNYSRQGFDEQDQIKLAQFFKKMDKKGSHLILSNSDPKNRDPNDDFFDRLYSGYKIERVPAKRNINANPNKRGPINELIVRNY